MSGAFRYRCLKVVVDTTEKAEFDFRELQLTSALLENVARRLREAAFSRRDRVVGDIRVREMFGYDFAYVVGREGDTIVITIGAAEKPNPKDPMEVVLARLGVVAILRGASGL